MAIRLDFNHSDKDLFGRSKIWGSPDMPESLRYPTSTCEGDGETYENPLTFICQIRCEDIAVLDTEGLLPHAGMLYFFAEVDYFLGNRDYDSPGMGEWSKDTFRVLYTSDGALHTHRITDEEGNDIGRPAEAIRFSACEDREDGFKLLGFPYFDEVGEHYTGLVSLLQLDCYDDWNLQFYDSGMLNILIDPQDLKKMQLADTICYLHSF